MFKKKYFLGFCVLGGFVGAIVPAQAQTTSIFHDGFEAAVSLLPDEEAARFLTQATFGPTAADIDHVVEIGYEAWIDEQLTTPVSLVRPPLEALSQQGVVVGQGQRLDQWFLNALSAPDQLRQRVAFALSQILVLSDSNDTLTNDWRGVAEYNDLLAQNAFGDYRSLLESVARHPQMGKYLSHWRNRKASDSTQPDENFAREIMQLFSIGLVWRDLDFSPILGPDNKPIPTYDQAVITELAQVFTGFGNQCLLPGCDPYSSLGPYDGIEPMACFPLYHDTSTKLLLDLNPDPALAQQVILPAGPVCDPKPAAMQDQMACMDYCESDLDGALDMLANHPNVAPFLSHQLIQRLITSNPSPAYVQRVATVFNSSGGNLGQTVRAILLDAEARTYSPTAIDFGQAPNAGKLREPLLKVTAIWRAFEAEPGQCSGSCMYQGNPPPGVFEPRLGLRNPETEFAQRPLGAPSVFNFYEPDYRHAGPVANAGLYSPELQILDESTAVSAANALWTVVWAGYNSGTGDFSQPTQYAYFPPAVIDALPGEPSALIDLLNLRLMYGSMSGSYVPGNCAAGTGMKGALYNLLQCAMQSAEHRRKVLGAIHLIAISPEFSVQR